MTKLIPALWKRSRRGLFRVVAVICALAAVTGGLAAVTSTSAPARADQTTTSGGPYAVTYSGGDVTASEDIAGVAPADVSNLLTTSWPEAVGLSAGASLTAIFKVKNGIIRNGGRFPCSRPFPSCRADGWRSRGRGHVVAACMRRHRPARQARRIARPVTTRAVSP